MNNFYNAVRGVMGLFSTTNKARGTDDESNASENFILPEFESSLKDDEIIKLTNQWLDFDSSYQKEIKRQQEDNVNYWIGKQFDDIEVAGTTKKPLVDNLIFEAIETFLPIATKGNPQANVYADGSENGNILAKNMSDALLYQAERQKLRMKLKGATRNWALYMIGCVKIVWDSNENDMDTKVILPSRLIFDKHAEIDVGGVYKGEYLGERKKISARRLKKMFPKKEKYIDELVSGNLGTKLTYIEWWTNFDLFFTLEGEVLGKFKNPHWNYDGKTTVVDPVTKEEIVEDVEGRNHFSAPQIPYLFLTIFNIGKRPHDDTSLVQQNIALQNDINKTKQQIARNVESQNNGIVLSGSHFTKEQAAEAATQLQRGNPLWVPSGDIRASYSRDSAPALSRDVYQHLEDSRNELRNIFGTSGSSPQGLEGQKTVRGKILINQLDSSRIGGGVTEYIEQLANSIYNWYVQMMYVYYTEEHKFSVVGPKAQEQKTIQNLQFGDIKFHVVVKDGSLIPKDPLTKRNEAMDLWSAGAIAPIPFFSALDYPNPYESAKELITWQLIQKGALPPQVMFPDLMAPPAPTGADQTNAVNPQEAQAEINPPAGLSTEQQSRQLIQSVPLG